MGLTKQYLRYLPAGNFNIIASSGCNVAFVVLNGQEGRYVAVGACEHVFVWDLRLGEKVSELSIHFQLCSKGFPYTFPLVRIKQLDSSMA